MLETETDEEESIPSNTPGARSNLAVHSKFKSESLNDVLFMNMCRTRRIPAEHNALFCYLTLFGASRLWLMSFCSSLGLRLGSYSRHLDRHIIVRYPSGISQLLREFLLPPWNLSTQTSLEHKKYSLYLLALQELPPFLLPLCNRLIQLLIIKPPFPPIPLTILLHQRSQHS